MKIILASFILFIFSLSSFNSLAKDGGVTDIGGGGNAIYNTNTHGELVLELEDFVEGMRQNPSAQLELGSSQNFEDKVYYVIQKITSVDSELGQAAFKIAENLFKDFNSHFRHMTFFYPIHDRGEEAPSMGQIPGVLRLGVNYIRYNCYSVKRSIYLNEDFFWFLDDNNQAGLIVHEILYLLARERGVKNAQGIRALVFLFCTKMDIHYNRHMYREFLQQHGLAYIFNR